MSIFLQKFPKNIAEELELRKKLIGRGKNDFENGLDSLMMKQPSVFRDYMNFLMGKMTWIKMTSNAIPRDFPPRVFNSKTGKEEIVPKPQYQKNETDKIENDSWKGWTMADDVRRVSKYDIRNKTILMGGNLYYDNSTQILSVRDGFTRMDGNDTQTGLDGIYGSRTYIDGTSVNKFLKPMTGITGVSISTDGNLGTIRKATIKWLCWDIDELEYYERVYLTPGLSVLLEWGWSTMEDLSKELSSHPIYADFGLNYRNPKKYFKSLSERVRNSRGRYDAMVGVISNYSYTIDGTGKIDCSTEIISPGKLLANFPVIDPKAKQNSLTLKDALEELDSISDGEVLKLKNNKEVKVHSIEWGGGTNKYITWAGFEDIINSYILPIVINDEGNLKTKEETEEITSEKTNATSSFDNTLMLRSTDLPDIDDNDLDITPRKFVYNNQFLVSCDPNVCLLPGQYSALSDGVPNQKDGIEPFYFKSGSAETSFTNSGKLFDVDTGILQNILLETKFVAKSFEGVNAMGSYMKKIFDGVSSACGSAFSFVLQVDTDNPFKIGVVDMNYAASDSTAYMFDARSHNSLVKNISVVSEIPAGSNLSSMLWIEANSVETSNMPETRTLWTRDGYQDGFLQKIQKPKIETSKNEIKDEDNTTKTKEKTEENSSENNEQNTTNEENKKNELMSDDESIKLIPELRFKWLLIEFLAALDKVYNAGGEGMIKVAKKRLKKLLKDPFLTGEDSIISNRLLPIKLNITLDGISGIYFGHAVSTNMMPERYLNNVVFMTTSVNHEINNSNWTTQLECQMRVAPNIYYIYDVVQNSDEVIVKPIPIKIRNLNDVDIDINDIIEKSKLQIVEAEETPIISETAGSETNSGTITNESKEAGKDKSDGKVVDVRVEIHGNNVIIAPILDRRTNDTNVVITTVDLISGQLYPSGNKWTVRAKKDNSTYLTIPLKWPDGRMFIYQKGKVYLVKVVAENGSSATGKFVCPIS